ncbi:MAG: ABC transporter ATP-binding protein [Cyanobacteria bacterium J06638_20]
MGTIRFEQVTLQFPRASRAAVKGVSGEIHAGELVVILGPSGCGKTTLLKMVNRLYEPTAGRICIDGQDIRRIQTTALRQKIGYVIQQSGLFPHMTVAANVAIVPRLLKWPPPKIQARVDELLHLVQLQPGDYRDRYPAQLSGGQQQRVGIARALAGEPEYMLMDEPFGAIDAITRRDLQTEILRLQQQLQKTILFVSHDVEEALRLGDRILIMREGTIAQFDTPLKLLTQPVDNFVHTLLGAGDRLRQLGLLSVTSVMVDLPMGQDATLDKPTLVRQASLRDALSLMLQTGSQELTVLDQDQPVGWLTLEHIRASAMEAQPA